MLPVRQGSWWKYRSVSDDSYQFDTGAGSDHTDTLFLLLLGAPTTVGGDPAFPVQRMVLASSCTSSPGPCTPEVAGSWGTWSNWGYLSFAGKRIRGSKDGQTYSVFFDANTAIWSATSAGMFGDFPSSTGARRAIPDPNNATQWTVEETNGSTDCTDIPEYGQVCGASGDLQNNAHEDYDPATGCVSSGSFGSTSSPTTNSNRNSTMSLVDSSVAADRRPPFVGDGCISFTSLPPTVAAIAATGSPSPATGGTLVDGLYQATALKVYGTSASAGTQVGTFSAQIQLQGTSFATQYSGSATPSFYGQGSVTASGSTLSMTTACSSVGSGTMSLSYSVTSSTTVDVITPGSGYTSVVTYTRL